jgi:hypothetical protein
MNTSDEQARQVRFTDRAGAYDGCAQHKELVGGKPSILRLAAGKLKEHSFPIRGKRTKLFFKTACTVTVIPAKAGIHYPVDKCINATKTVNLFPFQNLSVVKSPYGFPPSQE